MKIKSIWLKLLIVIFPIIAAILIILFRKELYHFGTLLPACPSYTYLHILCPGCGNTRSVQHLLTGDLTGSIRYNPVPLLGIIIGLLAYIELVTFIFNKPVKLIPRSKLFWVCVIIVFVLYYFIRNFIHLF